MFGLATRVLCISVGYLFPAYKCFKLLRGGPEAIGAASGASEQRDIVRGILKHWVVMSSFTAAELVADTFMFWLPLVGMVKLVFVVWLVLPGLNGAEIIYDRLVEPYLIQNEDTLDRYFRQARAAAHRSTESVSMSAYDRWVGYMQRAIGQSDTESPTEQQREVAGPGHSVYSGLAGLLKVVSQNLPHTSAATSNSNGVAEDAQTGPQPAAPEKSTFMSMLMSWTSSAASPGSSYEQRLRDIRSRKLQLQDMVSQLETSERTILDKTIPAQAESSPSQNEASEFEDDAVMVGEASAHAAAAAAKAKVSDGKKPLYRRWLW